MHTTYKGTASGTIKVRVMGGLEDIYLDEQLTALDSYDEKEIPVVIGMPKMEMAKPICLCFISIRILCQLPSIQNRECISLMTRRKKMSIHMFHPKKSSLTLEKISGRRLFLRIMRHGNKQTAAYAAVCLLLEMKSV